MIRSSQGGTVCIYEVHVFGVSLETCEDSRGRELSIGVHGKPRRVKDAEPRLKPLDHQVLSGEVDVIFG